MRPRVADASSSCRVSFGPESPTLDTLLQTATVSAKACFYAWTAGVPLSRYRTLPSNAVFQLLYAVGASSRTLPAEPAHPALGSPSSSGRPASNPIDGPVAVLNLLIALGSNGADIDKFWTALGEMDEDEAPKQSAAAEHVSTRDDYLESGNDVYFGFMAGGIPDRQPPLDIPHPLLQNQGRQAMLPSDMFIPPPRVGSVAPGQHEYTNTSLLPPAPIPTLQGAPGLSPTDPSQWAAAPLWDASASSWAPPAHSPNTMVPEGMDQQMWEEDQGNPQYGWGGPRY